MEEKLTHHWKIIEDPFAPESAWLPACEEVQRHEMSEPDKARVEPLALKPYTMSLLACLALAYCCASFALFTYDWGYEVIDALVGHEVFNAISQYPFALLCIGMITLPSSFGLFLGMVKERLQTRNVWCIAPMAVLSLSLALLANQAMKGAEVFWWTLCGACASWSCFQIGRHIYRGLRQRINPIKVLAPSLCYLIPAGVLFLFNLDGNFGYKEEIGVFLALTFCSGLAAAALARARSFTRALAAAFFSALPVVLVCAVNLVSLAIAFALSLFGTDTNPDVTAWSSALLIAVLSFASVCAGAFCGSKWARSKFGPTLRRLETR